MEKTLVICRYKESLDWIADVKIPCVVYDKYGDYENKSVLVVKSKNVGREAHCIANYCAFNYNKLSDITIFCQGNPFVHCPDFLDRINVDWEQPTPLSVYYNYNTPEAIKAFDLIEYQQNFEIVLGRADIFNGLNAPKGRNREWCELVWNLVFSMPPPPKIYFGYGAIWAVPKKNILNRKIIFWEWVSSILEGPAGLSKIDNDRKFPLNAWAWEILWHYVWNFYPDYFGNYSCKLLL